MKINEFARFTGVSVRTLHYYDEIGLLKPAMVDKITGYRYYDEKSLERMQEIMFYRELDFSLKEIEVILTSPGYDKMQALREQRKLLLMKKERMEKLIDAVDKAIEGEIDMSAFDKTKYEKYKEEARERWGNTEAYNEYEQKTKGNVDSKMIEGMDEIMRAFAECMKTGEEPASEATQKLVRKLQSYITDNFYTCTDEILSGLGKMYTADPRFTKNIDEHGEGTAEFISEAIGAYSVK